MSGKSDDIDLVGIAICAIDSSHRHIGILHRSDTSHELKLFELAMHCDLRNDSLVGEYLILRPGLDPDRLEQLAARCRQIWRKNKRAGIPYGFSLPICCFSKESAEYLQGPTQFGLTCATFVLAVFDDVGIRLVNFVDWPIDRPGDREWQQSMLALLRKRNAPTDHINRVATDVGVARFRPEEVAGASKESSYPVSFAVASGRAEEILVQL